MGWRVRGTYLDPAGFCDRRHVGAGKCCRRVKHVHNGMEWKLAAGSSAMLLICQSESIPGL